MFYTLFLIIIFIIACGFALLNPADVTVHYYLGQVKWPLAMVVILAFVIGGLLGMMIGYGKGRAASKRKYKAKLQKLEGKDD